MYHDEFSSKRPTRRRIGAGAEDRAAGLAFEAGGGVSLAMAASLCARAYLPAFFDLAAMVPLAATSASILVHRWIEAWRQVKSRTPTVARPTILRGPTRRPVRVAARRLV